MADSEAEVNISFIRFKRKLVEFLGFRIRRGTSQRIGRG